MRDVLQEYLKQYRQKLSIRRAKKQTRIANKAPKLTPEYIEEIMQKYIVPHNKELTYGIKVSNTTNSIYLELHYRNAKGKIRFSDHDTRRPVQSLNFNERADSTKQIVNIIQTRIKNLEYKSTMIMFEKLKRK